MYKKSLGKLAVMLISIIGVTAALQSCDECDRVKCANGGECRNGSCYCPDGVERPFCKKDTCIAVNNCVHGECEYGFCICDEYWGGESCDERTYIDHSGDYFGGFSCDNFVLNTTIEVSEVNQKDSFELEEEDSGFKYTVGFSSLYDFVIPRQVVEIDGEYTRYIQGSGKFEEGNLTMNVDYETVGYWGTYSYQQCSYDGFLEN